MKRALSSEQHRDVLSRSAGEDLDDAQVAHLVSVAERAMDDVAAPMLREALDVGEFVSQARGSQGAVRDDRVTPRQLGTQPIVVGAGHANNAFGQDLHAVAANLRASHAEQRGRRHALIPEVAVHVRGRRVARLAGVDDDHRTTLAPQLEGCGQPGG